MRLLTSGKANRVHVSVSPFLLIQHSFIIVSLCHCVTVSLFLLLCHCRAWPDNIFFYQKKLSTFYTQLWITCNLFFQLLLKSTLLFKNYPHNPQSYPQIITWIKSVLRETFLKITASVSCETICKNSSKCFTWNTMWNINKGVHTKSNFLSLSGLTRKSYLIAIKVLTDRVITKVHRLVSSSTLRHIRTHLLRRCV